jgi:hypothetical protein
MQGVLTPRIFDKLSEFIRAQLQILEVEYALGEPSEEPRHTVLQDLASQAQDGSAWKQFPTQRNQIVLIAASSMKQQQYGVSAGHKAMNKT